MICTLGLGRDDGVGERGDKHWRAGFGDVEEGGIERMVVRGGIVGVQDGLFELVRYCCSGEVGDLLYLVWWSDWEC